MDAGSRGGEDSHEDGASGLGHMVAMSARHFLRKTMGPQQPEFAADDCRTASPLLIRSGLRIVEQCLQIPVAKAVDEKLAMVDGSQQGLVLTPRAQTAHSTLVPNEGFLNLCGEFLH